MTAALRQIVQAERQRRAAAWKRDIAKASGDKARKLQASARADDEIWASIEQATRIGFRHCDADAAWRSICATLAAAIARHDAGKLPRAKVQDLLALRRWFWTWAPKEAETGARQEAKAA
ncbi:hypothetical protein PX699_00540 [Sphingobium sp. H39-3-25]|uniref:hypothetical protein n=1 Tax=Sphingobium arseniciresistens TaxID=3030834 RepID=UPI0023B8FE1C|nr:hypothetical protein [Sphingobium arseniciresistens]